MQKVILITGSSGLAGYAIAELLPKNYAIKGLDIHPGKFTTHTGSLTDWQIVREVCIGVDAILHTASLHAPHIATHSREDFVDTNIKGTHYLLEAARLH